MSPPRLRVLSLECFERDVHLRMPFRFGVVTLTEAPQAFVRARIRLEDGRESSGAAAEMLAPKWFDKDPRLTNEQNFDQLRTALALAREAYLAAGPDTAFGHWIGACDAHVARAATQGLNGLVAGYGPALIDRAVLDALCRALGLSFFGAVRQNAPGIEPPGLRRAVSAPHDGDLERVDFDAFLSGLSPRGRIAARHTVGLVDPITDADLSTRVADGLPETLSEVVAAYGHRWFKLKVAGNPRADVERLRAIAAVLDALGDAYQATLDGNEQYESADQVLELWRRIEEEPDLRRLAASIAFIEQPIARSRALLEDVRDLGAKRPVIIDESDDSLDAFPRARRLGYAGVSSKTCKGLYKSILNRARCQVYNRSAGADRHFMSGEDLTIQPGVALQQDLALVSLLGIEHVERNGHHYVNGMAGLPEPEQVAFLAAHPDLYERSHGAVRVRIVSGDLQLGSLGCAGFATAADPDWAAMTPMRWPGAALGR